MTSDVREAHVFLSDLGPIVVSPMSTSVPQEQK